MNFIRNLGSSLLTSEGLNAGMIDLGFRLYNVPEQSRPEYLDKIILYADLVMDHQRTKLKQEIEKSKKGARRG